MEDEIKQKEEVTIPRGPITPPPGVGSNEEDSE